MRKIVLTQEQTTDIINLYQIERCSITKIGARYGVSKHVISRVLRENSIEIRKDNHKYQADYRIFETIDSLKKHIGQVLLLQMDVSMKEKTIQKLGI